MTDESAVAELVRRTVVLVSTVGPYIRHGLPLVQACAQVGTHYADLTGETLFVRESVRQCHDTAVDSGARIVHSCGFDSIPSDLGVGLTALAAAAAGAGPLTDTVLRLRSGRGGISGGTVDSLRQQLLQVRRDPALRRVVAHPSALTGDGPGAQAPGGPRQGWRDPASAHWQAPFVMGGYNRQVVLRSHALTEGGYGPHFRYREVVDTGTGPLGALAAGAFAVGTAGLIGGLSLPPTRRLLDRLLPKPGEGPSERVRRDGRFALDVEADTESGARYRTRVAVEKDPGYGATAVMLGESALSLACDDLPDRAGVLTPMTALGTALADRLRAHGFTVSTTALPDAAETTRQG